MSYWLVWTWFLLLAFEKVQNKWENILLSVLKVLRLSASLKTACVVLSHSYSQSTEEVREVTVTLQVFQLEVISGSKKKENWEQTLKSYGAGWCTGWLRKRGIQRWVTFQRVSSTLKYIPLCLWNVTLYSLRNFLLYVSNLYMWQYIMQICQSAINSLPSQ